MLAVLYVSRLLYVVYAHVFGDTDLNTVHERLIHQLLTSAAGDCRDLRHCTMDGPPDPVAGIFTCNGDTEFNAESYTAAHIDHLSIGLGRIGRQSTVS